jgi:hypothetical protein
MTLFQAVLDRLPVGSFFISHGNGQRTASAASYGELPNFR